MWHTNLAVFSINFSIKCSLFLTSKPGVGQNIALHAVPAVRTSKFYPPSFLPSRLIQFHSLFPFILCLSYNHDQWNVINGKPKSYLWKQSISVLPWYDPLWFTGSVDVNPSNMTQKQKILSLCQVVWLNMILSMLLFMYPILSMCMCVYVCGVLTCYTLFIVDVNLLLLLWYFVSV